MKNLDSTYAKADLEQVSNNETQLNAEEITQLLRLLQYFGDLFDGIIGEWETDPVELHIKLEYKPSICKYYLVLRTNKGGFCKDLQFLLKIGVLTPLQHSQ